MLKFYSDPSKLQALRLLSKAAQSAVKSHPVEFICSVHTVLPKMDRRNRISLAVETEISVWMTRARFRGMLGYSHCKNKIKKKKIKILFCCRKSTTGWCILLLAFRDEIKCLNKENTKRNTYFMQWTAVILQKS